MVDRSVPSRCGANGYKYDEARDHDGVEGGGGELRTEREHDVRVELDQVRCVAVKPILVTAR